MAAESVLLGLTAAELAGLGSLASAGSVGLGVLGLMQNAMTPQQAPQQQTMQPAPANPAMAMQNINQIPMATYNPMMDDPMLMMMMGQQPMAPPRGLLY